MMYGACLVSDGLVMVGTARGEGHALKIDYTGNTVWSKSISINPFNEKPNTVCPTADFGLMVGGWVWVSGQRRDHCYIKLNADGDTLWTYTVGGWQDDHGRSIVKTYDGGYVLAGTSSSFYSGTCLYLTKITGPSEILAGDSNGDGILNIGDPIFILAYIFHGGPAPDPLCIADVNGDGIVDIGDAVYLLQYIFVHGPAPINGCDL
jgi:hypothetical protein